MARRAQFWRNIDGLVRCELCPQLCSIDNGKVGLCLVRLNKEGKLLTLNYGRISSISLDPIEKKPLYNFHPGSKILSVGSIGCNLGCPFCQNFEISHPKDFSIEINNQKLINKITRSLNINDLVNEAIETKNYGNIGVAFTYNEPLMSYEYLLNACKAIKEKGLFTVLVTNGYINPKPLNKILPLIDAMNIDLKAFTEDAYQQLEGHITPVKKTITTAVQSCHVEVTNLIVPGLNDDMEEIKQMVGWLSEIDETIPLHFSRYFPARHYKEEPTPLATIRAAEEIAKERLKYVYLGNI